MINSLDILKEIRGRNIYNKKVSLIVISVFLVVLLVGTVSALDWSGIDNYKVLEEKGKYGKIEIWDTGQFFLFQLDDRKLAEYTLTDNTDQCLINCYAEGTATLYEDGKLFSDLDFKNEVGKLVNLEESRILIWIIDGWEEYNFENLDVGTYNWRIEGKKNINQKVD